MNNPKTHGLKFHVSFDKFGLNSEIFAVQAQIQHQLVV